MRIPDTLRPVGKRRAIRLGKVLWREGGVPLTVPPSLTSARVPRVGIDRGGSTALRDPEQWGVRRLRGATERSPPPRGPDAGGPMGPTHAGGAAS
ncbi:hypothetical protein GCM10017674_79260 [Streptomyces gardneri]|uniref:Uncharacterized protein n=1 Tax=Streptomyces gardneri TaxID=66892 RepID=A0A4Y3RDS7_9ACTN|nr:hypothetical protein SGA01_11340 [Streptomyces gardneri]GHH23005.1 hypothetical protein GCM10017674_79260 [Streptomyces gardneri]